MKYHNEQEEKCKEAIMNSKGFCIHGKFNEQSCRCTIHKPCLCPYAWRYHEDQQKGS